MNQFIKTGRLLVVGVLILLASIVPTAKIAFADNLPIGNSIIPIENTPMCADAANGQAHWKIVNKNTSPVSITWTNIDSSIIGYYIAPTGESVMLTAYNSVDPNNTTQFKSGTDVTQTNSSNTACAPETPPVIPPTVPACIDGTNQQNLVASYTANNQVSIHTLDSQPLCNDVTVYLSDYIMPADYNGNGFYNNPTSTPQSLFDSTKAVLLAGTDGTSTLSVALPNSCNNVQIDVYYGPEITTVGTNGHGTQNILSQVYTSTGSCQVTPVTPITPVTPTQPPVTPTPVIGGLGSGQITPLVTPIISVAPAMLANTGVSPVLPTVVAAMTLVSAITISRKRHNV